MTEALATVRQNGHVANATTSLDDILPSPRMIDFCEKIAQSNLVPKDFRGRPADIIIAVQMGVEVGLKPIQALHSIAVINGRPALWGDGALAVVRARPDCEDVQETITGTGDDRTASCTIVRTGSSPVTQTFSALDAKRAKLFDKDGPWKQYPDRMLQMRARGFAMRDAFPDALKGFAIAEEAMDIPAEAAAAPDAPAAATRTQEVLAKVVGSATVDTPKDVAGSAGAGGNEAPAGGTDSGRSEFAATAATLTAEEEKQKARDLRNGIARAWQHIDPAARAAVLSREYAKSALTDLNVSQLSDFLERTPSLLPSPAPAEAPAE
jgi:hypothetical protein